MTAEQRLYQITDKKAVRRFAHISPEVKNKKAANEILELAIESGCFWASGDYLKQFGVEVSK